MTTPSPKDIQAQLAQLETAVRDLARDQRHLHEQIATLADRLDDLTMRTDSAVTGPAPPSAPSATDDWRAADSDLKGLARSVLRRARALWTATDPVTVEPPILKRSSRSARWHKLAVVIAAASRDVARESHPGFEALERQHQRGDIWLFWDRAHGRVRVEMPDGNLVREARGESAADIRRAASTPYLLTLTDAFAHALPSTLGFAQLALAMEPLAFLESPLAENSAPLLIAERGLWSFHGLDDHAFGRLSGGQRPVLGKVLPVNGERAWHHRPTTLRGFRQAGAYIVADPLRGKARQRLHSPSELELPDGDGPTTLALVDTLGGGVERFLADTIRQRGEPIAIVLTRPSDAFGRERQRLMSELTPWIYPVADRIPEALREDTMVWLALRFGRSQILDLRPESDAAPVGDLTSTRLSGPPSSYCTGLDRPGASAPESDPGSLGLPTGRRVISQIGDLIPRLRPEDFVALAHRLRDDERFVFVLAGRGPLAGTVDDLIRFHGLTNLHRLGAASLADVVRVSDVVCSMAADDPWPYPLLEALAQGRAVLAGAPWLREVHPKTPALEAGDIEAFASALTSFAEPRET